MSLPQNNETYGEKSYWDERYEKEDAFDWFADYDLFKHHLAKLVNKTDKILHLGCGNSLLPIKMYEDGFHNIVNVDYSSVVIEKMQNKWKHLIGMEWIVADIKDLTTYFPCFSFDIVLEKGTIDAMLVGEKDPWKLSMVGEQSIDLILRQVSTLLKSEGGRFISITFAQPHFRVPLYVASSEYNWDVTEYTFGTGLQYFLYSMMRGQKLTDYHQQLHLKYEHRKTKTDPIIFVSDSEDENFLLDSLNLEET